MRSQFLALLLMTIAAAGTFWYRSTANVCPAPLSYRIGTISPEFNMSEEQAKKYLTEAASVWEKPTSKDLFYYDPKGTVVVNFVFDERQAMADSQASQKKDLDAKKSENEALITSINQLRDTYETNSKAYQDKLHDYESRLGAYNDKVNRYNNQGGAPQNEFKKLESEKAVLNAESDSLNKTADSLNAQAQKINELSQKSSEVISAYNAQVQTYNGQFGFSREFTEGDYQSKRINIYKFSSENEVTKVLAHELGHALGMDHVEGKSSIMYYLIGDTTRSPELSTEDEAAFTLECSGMDSFSSQLRQRIRAFLQTVHIT
jgi:hypothetical protein